MTTIVSFCLSYDPLKWDFTAFKMNKISIRKRIVDTDDLIHRTTATSYDKCTYGDIHLIHNNLGLEKEREKRTLDACIKLNFKCSKAIL